MKQYNCILFDLDGTIANTYEGIFKSYKYVAEKMHLALPTEKLVNEAIGAKLPDVFSEKFGLAPDRIDEAIGHYRKRYAEQGIYEACAYPQMAETLTALKKRGKLIAVATLKKEDFANKMLEHLGLSQYFNVIAGMDTNDKLSKADIIRKVLLFLRQDADMTVMVGDSFYDAIGAKEAGVDFIGVTYGFGFKKAEDVLKYNNVGVVCTPIELCKII